MISLERRGAYIIARCGEGSFIIDFDRSVRNTKKELEAVLGGKAPQEEILKALNEFYAAIIQQGGAVQGEDENFVFTPSLECDDGRLVEQGYDGQSVYYVVYDPRTGKITKEDKIEANGKTYFPILNDDVRTGQVLFPTFPEEYGSDEQLIQDIRAFLDKWHEQRDEKERKLDVAYVFLTYIKDLLNELPYRRALGRYGGGKSTWLEVVGSVCYRPVYMAGCSTEASIRRTFDLWKGTALIDEADFSHSDLYAAVVKMLNVGFSKAHGYYRCCDENDSSKVLSFYVYGPKLLATRECFRDTALESRCLTFSAFENLSSKPLYRMDNFRKEAQGLRNKLLLWRFRNYCAFKEKAGRLEDAQLIDELFKGMDVKSRIKQVLTPLTLISSELKDGIVTLAEEISEDLKANDPEGQFEDEVKCALLALLDGGLKPRNVRNLYRGDVSVLRFKIKDIAEIMLLSELKEREKITSGALRSLATKLGFFFRRIGMKVRREEEGHNFVYVPEGWLKPYPYGGFEGFNVSETQSQPQAGQDAEQLNPPSHIGSKGSNDQPDGGLKPCSHIGFEGFNVSEDRAKERCFTCQEYIPQYEICGLDGEHKEPGFFCNRYQPRPIERKCLTCRHWGGSSMTLNAFCHKKGESSSQDGGCDSWEAK